MREPIINHRLLQFHGSRADIQVKSHSNKHTPKGSAICVQRFNDSQTSAVRITYRSSLRSSSIQEPRYPS